MEATLQPGRTSHSYTIRVRVQSPLSAIPEPEPEELTFTTLELLNMEVCVARRVRELEDMIEQHPDLKMVAEEMLGCYRPLLEKLRVHNAR